MKIAEKNLVLPLMDTGRENSGHSSEATSTTVNFQDLSCRKWHTEPDIGLGYHQSNSWKTRCYYFRSGVTSHQLMFMF